MFHLRSPRIVWLWLRAWQRLLSLLFRVGGWPVGGRLAGGWVGGGIGTKASPSILLWLRALQHVNILVIIDSAQKAKLVHSTKFALKITKARDTPTYSCQVRGCSGSCIA